MFKMRWTKAIHTKCPLMEVTSLCGIIGIILELSYVLFPSLRSIKIIETMIRDSRLKGVNASEMQWFSNRSFSRQKISENIPYMEHLGCVCVCVSFFVDLDWLLTCNLRRFRKLQPLIYSEKEVDLVDVGEEDPDVKQIRCLFGRTVITTSADLTWNVIRNGLNLIYAHIT